MLACREGNLFLLLGRQNCGKKFCEPVFTPPQQSCLSPDEWFWEKELRRCASPLRPEGWLVLSPQHLRRALSFLPLRQGLQFSLSRETSQECDWRTSQVAPHSVSNNTDILISNSNVLCLNLFQSEKGNKRAGVL